jgi:hypothetical protein
MRCTGGRLVRVMEWKVFRPPPVMSDVLSLKNSLRELESWTMRDFNFLHQRTWLPVTGTVGAAELT